MTLAESKFAEMLAGQAVIASPETMEGIEAIVSGRDIDDMASAHNAARLGMKDVYVVWLGRHGNAPNVKIGNHYATANAGPCKP
jgi:hypothetical protein